MSEVNKEHTKSAPKTMASRPALATDLEQIARLLNFYATKELLLARPHAELVQNITHFRVIEDNNQIVACGSLEAFNPQLAEVRSLMVAQRYKGRGLGGKVLADLLQVAQKRRINRVMALTYVPDFFHRYGFTTVDKAIFPEKVWGICVNCPKNDHCDEIAVLHEQPIKG